LAVWATPFFGVPWLDTAFILTGEASFLSCVLMNFVEEIGMD